VSTETRGRKREWTTDRQFELEVCINHLIETGQARSLRQACEILATMDPWTEHTASTLRRRYFKLSESFNRWLARLPIR